MKRGKKRRWTKKELINLKKYIIYKSKILLNNFYRNVIYGYIKFRKPTGFFIEMARTLGLTSPQCKSKFQKFEKEIYTLYLELPEESYIVLKYIRKQKKKVKIANEKTTFLIDGEDDLFTRKVVYMQSNNNLLLDNWDTNIKPKSIEMIKKFDDIQMNQYRELIIEFYNDHIVSNPSILFSSFIFLLNFIIIKRSKCETQRSVYIAN